jgi:hypothetical protein
MTVVTPPSSFRGSRLLLASMAFILAAQVLPHLPTACSTSETELLLRTRALVQAREDGGKYRRDPGANAEISTLLTTTTTRTSPLRAQARTNRRRAKRRRRDDRSRRRYAKCALPRSGRRCDWPRGHGDTRTVEPIEGGSPKRISNALSPPPRAEGELDNGARISPTLNARVAARATTPPMPQTQKPRKKRGLVVPRDRIELPTRGFSILCSTD